MAFQPYPGGAVSPYNSEPGSGRTGYWEVPPNNYDFYSEAEKYKPNIQADGGVLSSALAGAHRRHAGELHASQTRWHLERAPPGHFTPPSLQLNARPAPQPGSRTTTPRPSRLTRTARRPLSGACPMVRLWEQHWRRARG